MRTSLLLPALLALLVVGGCDSSNYRCDDASRCRYSGPIRLDSKCNEQVLPGFKPGFQSCASEPYLVESAQCPERCIVANADDPCPSICGDYCCVQRAPDTSGSVKYGRELVYQTSTGGDEFRATTDWQCTEQFPCREDHLLWFSPIEHSRHPDQIEVTDALRDHELSCECDGPVKCTIRHCEGEGCTHAP